LQPDIFFISLKNFIGNVLNEIIGKGIDFKKMEQEKQKSKIEGNKLIKKIFSHKSDCNMK